MRNSSRSWFIARQLAHANAQNDAHVRSWRLHLIAEMNRETQELGLCD